MERRSPLRQSLSRLNLNISSNRRGRHKASRNSMHNRKRDLLRASRNSMPSSRRGPHKARLNSMHSRRGQHKASRNSMPSSKHGRHKASRNSMPSSKRGQHKASCSNMHNSKRGPHKASRSSAPSSRQSRFKISRSKARIGHNRALRNSNVLNRPAGRSTGPETGRATIAPGHSAVGTAATGSPTSSMVETSAAITDSALGVSPSSWWEGIRASNMTASGSA